MARKSQKKDGVLRVRVVPELTIYTALAQKQELLSALEQAFSLELDCSQITELDSAGMQLLIMLKQEAARSGATLALSGHSQVLTDVLDTFNLAGYFGDPIVVSASD